MARIKNTTNHERIYYTCMHYNEPKYVILNDSPIFDGEKYLTETRFEIYDINDNLLARYNKYCFETPYTYQFGLTFDKNEPIELMFEKMKIKQLSKQNA